MSVQHTNKLCRAVLLICCAAAAPCPFLTALTLLHADLPSPAHTPSSAHRPNSGRARAVQFLVDAVRSKDATRFQDALDYLRLPNGAIAGAWLCVAGACACGCVWVGACLRARVCH